MKTYTAAMLAELDESHLTTVIFVEAVLDARTDRYSSAGYDITWDGQEWIGLNGVVGIEPIEEGDDLTARGIKFSIPGLSPAETSSFFQTKLQGRKVTVWLALVGPNGIISDPSVEFIGRLDAPERARAQNGETLITIPAESRLAHWGRPTGSRFTYNEQLRRYPGDTYFKHMAAVTTQAEVIWPSREYGRK